MVKCHAEKVKGKGCSVEVRNREGRLMTTTKRQIFAGSLPDLKNIFP
jgi:biotin operon repressor